MKPAFTLVEMLVAMALGTMLMVSLLGITSRMATANIVLEATEQVPAWLNRVFDTMETDLRQASVLKNSEGNIVLNMPLCLEPQTTTCRNIQVRWEVKDTDSGLLLVRAVYAKLNNQWVFAESNLAAMQVESISITPLEKEEDETSVSSEANPPQAAGQGVVISIQTSDSEVPFQRTVALP